MPRDYNFGLHRHNEHDSVLYIDANDLARVSSIAPGNSGFTLGNYRWR